MKDAYSISLNPSVTNTSMMPMGGYFGSGTEAGASTGHGRDMQQNNPSASILQFDKCVFVLNEQQQ